MLLSTLALSCSFCSSANLLFLIFCFPYLSHVRLVNGARCDQIKWCLAGALTVGASSTLYGSVVTGPTSAITLGAGSTIRGSLSAGNGIITVGAAVNLASCGH